ncbi:response regulator receiver domain-containing protein [Hasllibacter halocynthiae]|uniref:Response regulator receiver domain-containing protein n=1 Tax=Hasllibacter halocynthiae TaxID=595589 RepID=A0A2T0X385_9RHOB|nr:response regulator [Hasllibacter halocynthiae]PRY93400.1 response regulator receiver domain-containing protein [Hasllibacter halocynthiae]
MHVLIVEPDAALSALWARVLRRLGHQVFEARGQRDAVRTIRERAVEVIILDLVLEEGSAIATADYAGYARPDAQVITVTSSSFFSDGSIFQHMPNARAFVRTGTSPEDLAAMAEHYGGVLGRSSPGAAPGRRDAELPPLSGVADSP